MGRPNGLRLETIAADAGAEMRSTESLECSQERSASIRDAWPTPTATPYGSSQNGINGLGGENERPSANTPSLERLSRSFLLVPTASTDGDDCSLTGPNSRQHWSTPRAEERQQTNSRDENQALSKQIQTMAASTSKPKLNAMFVEFLMGLPIGWTGCAPAAMAWSLWWRPSRSAFLRIVSASGLPVATSEKARS